MRGPIYKSFFIIALIFSCLPQNAFSAPSHHLVGWVNAFIPGSGQLMMGNTDRAAKEFTLSVGSFGLGYGIAKSGPLTLDGVPSELPKLDYHHGRGATETNVTTDLYAEILQEVGLKSHMTFAFLAYRDAAKENGITAYIDQSSVKDLFLSPFDPENLLNPWVITPIIFSGLFALTDFYITKTAGLPDVPRFTPYSNFLYSVNYQIIRPIGSGAPEEMFYRGFLQNELRSVVDSPWFTIPLSSTAFAFSHAPGYGRLAAGLAGAYLGILAHKYEGNLKPGITVHFWSSIILGIETTFLLHDAQRTTPPAALSVQINY